MSLEDYVDIKSGNGTRYWTKASLKGTKHKSKGNNPEE
jgi:hypothetical protein